MFQGLNRAIPEALNAVTPRAYQMMVMDSGLDKFVPAGLAAQMRGPNQSGAFKTRQQAMDCGQVAAAGGDGPVERFGGRWLMMLQGLHQAAPRPSRF